jgi:ATP phosphoribosyltransferase
VTTRIAIPSKGRLRDSVLDLLRKAGYNVAAIRNASASTVAEDIEFIEMRPRDAAAWLAAGQLTAAFISTDTALENAIDAWPSVPLGFSRSDLVLACRVDAPYRSAADLTGRTVATHLPTTTERWFATQGVGVDVVAMGGSLEGICARGMADAIVDLRETGGSLARNSLHAIEVLEPCQAIFSMADESIPAVAGMKLRIEAAQAAQATQYLMLHLPPAKIDDLGTIFPGLAAPTVLPLAGRDDLVAAHMVVERDRLWAHLAALRDLGATGIVALPTDAILE